MHKLEFKLKLERTCGKETATDRALRITAHSHQPPTLNMAATSIWGQSLDSNTRMRAN